MPDPIVSMGQRVLSPVVSVIPLDYRRCLLCLYVSHGARHGVTIKMGSIDKALPSRGNVTRIVISDAAKISIIFHINQKFLRFYKYFAK